MVMSSILLKEEEECVTFCSCCGESSIICSLSTHHSTMCMYEWEYRFTTEKPSKCWASSEHDHMLLWESSLLGGDATFCVTMATFDVMASWNTSCTVGAYTTSACGPAFFQGDVVHWLFKHYRDCAYLSLPLIAKQIDVWRNVVSSFTSSHLFVM